MSSLKTKIKKEIKSKLRAWFAPKVHAADFRRGLEALNVPKDKPVLVHSSLSAFGFVPRGPQALLEAIQSYLHSDAAIVLPTHSWNLVNRGLRTFDSRSTPSCVGAITEWFRHQPGVIRSLHPTHSVAALGPLAAEITQRHEDSLTPCGPGSPYERLLAMDATILFFGAPLETNTSYHCCEGIVGVPYLLQKEKCVFDLIDHSGRAICKEISLHAAGIARNLKNMNNSMTESGILFNALIGKRMIHSIRGLAFRDFLCKQLQSEPNYFLGH